MRNSVRLMQTKLTPTMPKPVERSSFVMPWAFRKEAMVVPSACFSLDTSVYLMNSSYHGGAVDSLNLQFTQVDVPFSCGKEQKNVLIKRFSRCQRTFYRL